MDMLRRKIGGVYLVSHIGAGGMSNVYLGVNPKTREKWAVKVLVKRATENPAAYARFLREVDIIRGLNHPHIVKVLDSGALDDCYFYTMEYMSGGNLAERMAKGKIPLSETVNIFAQVCDAMAHAHDRGVIHRDLKPANILIDSQGSVQVSDFGIAKALTGGVPTLTASSEIIGTIAYLAPEQRLSAKKVDRRADVYGLGALLYEMVMGFPPLGKFPWPRETQPSFSPRLQAMIAKCLATDPEDRYQHAGLLLFEVDSYRKTLGPCGSHTEPQEGPALRLETEAKRVLEANSDRIESWLRTLRLGTTRERLSTVREMIEKMEPCEAKAVLKLFEGEDDRVRWGLIRVLGELRVPGATRIILNELKRPYHREVAIEALGKIGSEEAFPAIRRFLAENPESANLVLLPLARTGKLKALRDLRHYLADRLAVVRQSAVRAIAAIESQECLQILREHMSVEPDDRVRKAVQQSMQSLETTLMQKETIHSS